MTWAPAARGRKAEVDGLVCGPFGIHKHGSAPGWWWSLSDRGTGLRITCLGQLEQVKALAEHLVPYWEGGRLAAPREELKAIIAPFTRAVRAGSWRAWRAACRVRIGSAHQGEPEAQRISHREQLRLDGQRIEFVEDGLPYDVVLEYLERHERIVKVEGYATVYEIESALDASSARVVMSKHSPHASARAALRALAFCFGVSVEEAADVVSGVG